MNATLNHAPRKKLSDQLDRLDNILDGLSEAIPAVVADAVRQAVREGVQAAITEILANPDLISVLKTEPTVTSVLDAAPTTVPSPTLVSRITRGLWSRTCRAGTQIASLGTAAHSALTSVGNTFATGWSYVRPLIPSVSTLATLALAITS